ncbi:MAG: hypothetical protein EZS28_049385, partial [Streblomastix strix]
DIDGPFMIMKTKEGCEVEFGANYIQFDTYYASLALKGKNENDQEQKDKINLLLWQYEQQQLSSQNAFYTGLRRGTQLRPGTYFFVLGSLPKEAALAIALATGNSSLLDRIIQSLPPTHSLHKLAAPLPAALLAAAVQQQQQSNTSSSSSYTKQLSAIASFLPKRNLIPCFPPRTSLLSSETLVLPSGTLFFTDWRMETFIISAAHTTINALSYVEETQTQILLMTPAASTKRLRSIEFCSSALLVLAFV